MLAKIPIFSKLEFHIAARYLKTKKHDGVISIVSALSIVGIALGVATLIIVMSVMNGFRTELLSRILGVNSHISIYGNGHDIPGYDNIIKQLGINEDILSAIPMVEGHAIISNPRFGKVTEGIKVRGIKMEDFVANELLNNKNFQGDTAYFDIPSNPEGVIIGSRLAQALNAYPGDEVQIITPQTSSTVLGSVPRKKTFVIAGTFDVGMFEYDRHMIYMPFEIAQKMYNYRHSAESISVMIKDINESFPTAVKLQQELGREYMVVDWQQQNSQFFGAVKTERNVMFIILTLIVIVASFNIISSMIMLVKDKSKAIAIMRTMGATRGSIMRIFMLAGSFNGIVGTFSGVILGLLFSYNIDSIKGLVESITGGELFSAEIYFLSQLPAEVHFDEVMQVVGITLLISLAATIYPALRASKLDPAEALRYE